MSEEFFLEIGTEEIPARFLPDAMKNLEELLKKEFEKNRLSYGIIRTFSTPRRICALVEELSSYQDDLIVEKMGPAKKVAFDINGNPLKPALGFAKSQGLKVDDLIVKETPKGEYVFAIKKIKGKEALEVLKTILPDIILKIPFPKTMRWNSLSIRFVRPIHWIVAILSGKVIPFSLENIKSGNKTFGHRFMKPNSFEINSFSDYIMKTEEAFVIVDPDKRKKMIENDIKKEAKKVNGMPLMVEGLLEEVIFLTEYPNLILGSFDKEFLMLPSEVLTNAMVEHQRYFPIIDNEGSIMPYFIAVNNILPKEKDLIKNGHERVLRARLSDARFYFDEDLMVKMDKWVEELKKVVFQTKLGTSYEKMTRFKALALFISELLDINKQEKIDRAATLCKADLVSGMVGEFPKLQGVMGRIYAIKAGEDIEVADAIYEHYLPRFSGDKLPAGPIGDIISIADRMDTIIGCFGIGIIPTGTQDPYGLRRHTLAIINIIIRKGYRISLSKIIDKSLELIAEKIERPKDDIKREVLVFFRSRFFSLLVSQGFSPDLVEGVLSANFDDLYDALLRVEALNRMRKREEFLPLAIAFKRVMNILKERALVEVNPELFEESQEKKLFSSIQHIKEKFNNLINESKYDDALFLLASLKEDIDQFFDHVLVMADDKRIRENRLALLDGVASLFTRIADFSKISVE
ncbi:MAG: glycine--tRNA ligase subunit beta [Deltaproteobacteria bacterium]|nr:MAG: glycine--tRNA ligase subunit beta [Deltaproteobacteria bacterium]